VLPSDEYAMPFGSFQYSLAQFETHETLGTYEGDFISRYSSFPAIFRLG